MVTKYTEQNPLKALLFHSGVDEEPYFTENPSRYVLWIGRLDKDKAPHYAVEAAKILNIPLYILGKPVYQPEYFKKNKKYFTQKSVTLLGVKHGKEKMHIISKASCLIYTLDKHYIEAGAGVLGEALSCGIPIAGITWTGNDAVAEAVDHAALGKVVNVSHVPDKLIPQSIADAVRYCLRLDRKEVYKIGSQKYEPHHLVRAMFQKVDLMRNG